MKKIIKLLSVSLVFSLIFTSIAQSATVLFPAQGGTGASTLTGVLIGNGTSAFTATPLGAGQSIRRNAGNTAYEAFTAGAGDVVGPASSTDNAVTRFDSTTGKLLQNSGIIIGDNNDVSGFNTVQYNTAPTSIPTTEGTAFWDATDHTVSLRTDQTGVTLQVGQEMYVRARNSTGVTITNGQVVYVSGSTGQRPNITLAKADAIATSQGTIGIATHDIANNTDGIVTVLGLVRDLDTSAFLDGDILYLSATTAGAVVSTAPASPSFVVEIGHVIKAHITQGVILVDIIRPMVSTEVSTTVSGFNRLLSSADADVQKALDTIDNSALGASTTDTLSNKSISLGSNTVTGTIAQFNTALSDGDFATGGGTATGTNTGDQTSVSGTSGNTNALNSATTVVNVSSATAPSTGQVLTATSSTAATWQTPAVGGDVSKVGTPVNNQVGVWTGDGTIEGDAALTFDTTTDTLTSVTFAGNLTGNVTGNVSGTAATVTGAAQANITSLGTLTTLTVDDITINGNTISSAGATSLAITPTVGQAILLDGTISVDAGVVTGATSITSTTFVGALTGTASGNLVSGGALGTPSSATLTNATGLPVAGITASTVTALGVGSLELGHASDTTLSRVSAGVAAIEGVRVITSAGVTANTILKNNGTTFVASTETYAAPGTTGNVMTSDGTNWTSAAPSGGGGISYAADAGSTDDYAITVSPVPASYAVGDVYLFKANTANTGAATLNVNSLGAVTIKKKSFTDLANNDILSQMMVMVAYNGSPLGVLDSYSESNRNTDRLCFSGDETSQGQSWLNSSVTILQQAKFHLSKGGSPTGNVVAKLYAHSGTFGTSSVPTGAALATSDNIDISTLTASPALVTFTFSGVNKIMLSASTYYVIQVEYTGGSGINYLKVGVDSTSPTHGGNGSYFKAAAWNAIADDIIFYVYGASERFEMLSQIAN